tara:strand:- start:2506 stop:3150 length:645 start_codon:yes stop_codon:yes gene_type:complete
MKLISEYNEAKPLIESKDNGKKDYFIEGVFMQADIKNRNGRVYPKEIMDKEVKRYIKEFVNEQRAFGELGHPEGPTINLDKVSHMITELNEDGANWVGKAKILSTPNGEIVKNLIDDGAKLGVSSRGLGSLEQKSDAQYVKSDFQLATAGDIVADPSAPDAFVDGIMEGVEWIMDNGILKRQEMESMREVLKNEKQIRLEETKINLWKTFVKNL